jgi:hypothetical protein
MRFLSLVVELIDPICCLQTQQGWWIPVSLLGGLCAVRDIIILCTNQSFPRPLNYWLYHYCESVWDNGTLQVLVWGLGDWQTLRVACLVRPEKSPRSSQVEWGRIRPKIVSNLFYHSSLRIIKLAIQPEEPLHAVFCQPNLVGHSARIYTSKNSPLAQLPWEPRSPHHYASALWQHASVPYRSARVLPLIYRCVAIVHNPESPQERP